MSHLHSPAPTNRSGVRQVQVLRERSPEAISHSMRRLLRRNRRSSQRHTHYATSNFGSHLVRPHVCAADNTSAAFTSRDPGCASDPDSRRSTNHGDFFDAVFTRGFFARVESFFDGKDSRGADAKIFNLSSISAGWAIAAGLC